MYIEVTMMHTGIVFVSTPSIVRVLKGSTLSRPPFWLMRQAGRYLPEYRILRQQSGSFLDLCLAPRLAMEVTLQPVRRFCPDAAILFSDILIVPFGLGQAVTFKEGHGPVLDPVRDGKDVAALSMDAVWPRIEATYETVERVRGGLDPDICLIGFAGAPWTVATYMVEGGSSRDFARTKRWAYEDPAGFGDLIDLVTEATIRHLSAQIGAGADVVKLFDSWAGVLAPAEFRRWSIEPARKICRALRQKYPDIPIIGFPRGAGPGYIEYVIATGVDAVALDTGISTVWAAREVQTRLPVQGNMDPVALLCGGETMIRAIREISRNLQSGPFIFNLGHGVLPDTPPEHVSALSNFLRFQN